jgi:hypothetical protein
VESHATCVLFGTTFDTRTTAEQENGIFNVGECDDELQWAFDGSGLSQDVVSTNYPYLDDARQLGHGEISHDLANDLKVDAGFERGNTGLQSQAASIPRREMG